MPNQRTDMDNTHASYTHAQPCKSRDASHDHHTTKLRPLPSATKPCPRAWQDAHLRRKPTLALRVSSDVHYHAHIEHDGARQGDGATISVRDVIPAKCIGTIRGDVHVCVWRVRSWPTSTGSRGTYVILTKRDASEPLDTPHVVLILWAYVIRL